MLPGSVLEEHDVPAPPVGADHRQEALMCLLGPLLGDQERYVPGLDVDRPVKDALGAVPRDRDPDLLARMTVAGVERWSLGDDRLVEHQHHGADTAAQAAFQPPFDCRQVSGRRASWWRGRFHRRSRRARARLTVLRETATS